MNNGSMKSVYKRRRQSEKSVISKRLRDFRHEWLRQRRARVDWNNIFEPCVENMVWGLVKDHWGKSNRSNAATSEIIFKDIRPAGEFSKIFIQSKTSDNRTKLIGGDTWRVYVRGPASIAATVFDHNNGTYEALFLIMEPGVYQLIVYLDYSLCDGFKDPPRDWFIIGDAQGTHQKDGVLGPLDEYLVKQPFNNGQPALTINVIKAQLKGSLSGKKTNLKDLSPVRKPASIYGMDLVNGKMTSGCHILKQSLTIGRCRKITHNLERFGSTVIHWVVGYTGLSRLDLCVNYFIKNAETATCGSTMLTTKA